MDGRAFDRLAVAVGRAASRRRVVRSAVGVLAAAVAGAAGRSAAARGFACAGVGDWCSFDAHCCGALLCIDGACVDYDDYINTLGDLTDDILPGDAVFGGAGSLGLGEPCIDPSQCYSGSGLEATCADNGIDPGGICCTTYGFGCADDRHCCGSLICVGFACTVPYEGFG